ncbi:hypothetical protein PR202_gb08444 [Eleusine coracana subsp. coracana]|uniref:Uncharacterized protein n=1 Tax=Eleusine coracana subsp. coracana TaxID=191504 RepID=A0AAV5EC80_ELECO|nr:hypothetical protein PR202_gb08444 [Eleusine coracana subsp. coracana]
MATGFGRSGASPKRAEAEVEIGEESAPEECGPEMRAFDALASRSWSQLANSVWRLSMFTQVRWRQRNGPGCAARASDTEVVWLRGGTVAPRGSVAAAGGKTLQATISGRMWASTGRSGTVRRTRRQRLECTVVRAVLGGDAGDDVVEDLDGEAPDAVDSVGGGARRYTAWERGLCRDLLHQHENGNGVPALQHLCYGVHVEAAGGETGGGI